MALLNLEISGFRAVVGAALEFGTGQNYLFGPNGAGKTTILEAIHYLALGRSFRRAADRDLLGYSSECLSVDGEDDAGNRADIRFNGREKRVTLNAMKVERLSAFLGWLPIVALMLDDLDLVRGAPAGRRGFLDLVLAKTDRAYIGALSEYRRALMQRNRLLEQSASDESHSVWEEELVRTGGPVMESRAAIAGRLLGKADSHYTTLSGIVGRFVYRPSIAPGAGAAEEFRRRLRATRRQAIQTGHTPVGPHRDDITLHSADHDLRRFGSVGEQRMAAIALRLAEADILTESVRGRPLFLLDEIAAELDDTRSSRVLELVAGSGQMVYAAAREFDTSGRVFHVEAGKVARAS